MKILISWGIVEDKHLWLKILTGIKNAGYEVKNSSSDIDYKVIDGPGSLFYNITAASDVQGVYLANFNQNEVRPYWLTESQSRHLSSGHILNKPVFSFNEIYIPTISLIKEAYDDMRKQVDGFDRAFTAIQEQSIEQSEQNNILKPYCKVIGTNWELLKKHMEEHYKTTHI
jgi:hypothetical protein